MELPFDLEPYLLANSSWISSGKHILASYTENCVILYQAYKPDIAKWVVEHQTFTSCPGYSTERMTWVKPNFLWMMYRSGWATKTNQESILAITIIREGFTQLLKLCKRQDTDPSLMGTEMGSEGKESFGENDVRIQWDPDHDPFGDKVERRAIQLGIRGNTLRKFLEEWIISIADITKFVKCQHLHVRNNELNLLNVPVQRVIDVSDEKLRAHIGLS